MLRTLDLTALRSFVAVADVGGVTRAAGFLNLTQSAVSMQIKRLEESLGQQLFDRSGRGVTLTPAGEQLLSYARRMLELNDAVLARMTDQAYEGTITLGVPHDIIYPVIPQVMQRMAQAFPRVRIQLTSSFTVVLKEQFERGECDMILTTEDVADAGGECLMQLPLIWVGAPNGLAWRSRPLRLAFEQRCRFRQGAQESLDAAGIPWEMTVTSEHVRPIEVSVAADLAVSVRLDGMMEPVFERIEHHGALPDLGIRAINLYSARTGMNEVLEELARLLRQGFSSLPRPALTRAA